MPQSKMKKGAAGIGTIRKKNITRNGKKYTYWEARYTEGFDPETGKQIQRSITGKTQKEVAQRLKAETYAIDIGSYISPNKMTLAEWLDIWTDEYLINVKPRTVDAYKSICDYHLKPKLGHIPLQSLEPHMIQCFYNHLVNQKNGKPLTAKTVKNVHGVLHRALRQAVKNKYMRDNPVDACELPSGKRHELHPLDEDQIATFLKAVQGHRFEDLYIVTLFTGMRRGEAIGLTWECVDLRRGTIMVKQQLQKVRGTNGHCELTPTKNSRCRSLTVAPFVVDILRNIKIKQAENRLRNAALWQESDFVFTNEVGEHLRHQTVYKDFKDLVAKIGTPKTRFHDLRHSFAIMSIRSGDDIKTVQENLGHATAAFTLDIYGHVTDKMKQESANRMERFIRSVIA